MKHTRAFGSQRGMKITPHSNPILQVGTTRNRGERELNNPPPLMAMARRGRAKVDGKTRHFRNNTGKWIIAAVVAVTVVFSGKVVMAGSSDVSIEGASAIFSPKMPDTGAVFLRIINKGDMDDALVGVNINITKVRAALHDTKDGKMVKTERIIIPARGAVELKRGGLHIMLYDLPSDIKEGQEYSLTLRFEKSGEKDVRVKFMGGRLHDMHKH